MRTVCAVSWLGLAFANSCDSGWRSGELDRDIACYCLTKLEVESKREARGRAMVSKRASIKLEMVPVRGRLQRYG